MRILRHHDVLLALDGREPDTIQVVRNAYRAHHQGRTIVPYSSFLRLPGSAGERIIALPAYLDGTTSVAGIKWIASFPQNIARGLPRASASIILNSLDTGWPVAMIEGSLISARRTAASAAVAASLLCQPGDADGVALFGCGAINHEVFRFLSIAFPGLSEVTLFDADHARAVQCAATCQSMAPAVSVRLAPDAVSALGAHRLVSIATTATQPHVNAGVFQPGATVLHLSLRDIWPDGILTCQNVVDDAGHVCREGTSLFLAEELTGGREFIGASIGELLCGRSDFTREPGRTVIFSPFGLGALDVALAEFVLTAAVSRGLGTEIEDFIPRAECTPLAASGSVRTSESGGNASAEKTIPLQK
jgi:ornithine cyclodeaminase